MKLAEWFVFNAEDAGSRGGEPPGVALEARSSRSNQPVELAGLEHESGRFWLARNRALRHR
jgi:hypothetical protein